MESISKCQEIANEKSLQEYKDIFLEGIGKFIPKEYAIDTSALMTSDDFNLYENPMTFLSFVFNKSLVSAKDLEKMSLLEKRVMFENMGSAANWSISVYPQNRVCIFQSMDIASKKEISNNRYGDIPISLRFSDGYRPSFSKSIIDCSEKLLDIKKKMSGKVLVAMAPSIDGEKVFRREGYLNNYDNKYLRKSFSNCRFSNILKEYRCLYKVK